MVLLITFIFIFLQVGQARRQAIINKQDKAIKELEDKLSKQVEPTRESNQQVDYLLKQHHQQVSEKMGKTSRSTTS